LKIFLSFDIGIANEADEEPADVQVKNISAESCKPLDFRRWLHTIDWVAEKILLVEDDSITRKSISETLTNEGYEVTEAKDGAEALKLLTRDRFDLVLSDLVLPKVHGLKLVELLRTKFPGTPTVVMSGYLSRDSGTTILEGWAEFIEKPIDSDVLLAAIKHLLMKDR
jgi:DNA-binding NtrC family response regulator